MNFFEFLTRAGCHLCDQARPLVVDQVRRGGGEVREVDIDGVDGLLRDYGLRIPVLLGPDGAVVAEGVIDRRSLRRELRRYRKKKG
jgi:hypothetical protein